MIAVKRTLNAPYSAPRFLTAHALAASGSRRGYVLMHLMVLHAF